MNNSISYKIGYFLAGKPKLQAVLLIGLFVVAPLLAIYAGRDQKNSNSTSTQEPTNAVKFGCASQRLENYQKLMSESSFWAASLQIAPCETVKDGNDYAAMRRESEKRHYENEILISKNDLARKYSAVDKLIDSGHPVSAELAQQSRRFHESEFKKAAAAEAKRRRSEGVSIGMTEKDVLASSWGKPERVNTTTRASGKSAQWVYGRSYLYFKDGLLVTIQN